MCMYVCVCMCAHVCVCVCVCCCVGGYGSPFYLCTETSQSHACVGLTTRCICCTCRDFKISCVGVGVLPPLQLSHQVVHFAATALYDVSTAAFHVLNNHTSSNEFTHPVPRIGTKGTPLSVWNRANRRLNPQPPTTIPTEG